MNERHTLQTSPKVDQDDRPRNGERSELSVLAYGGMAACGASFAVVTYLEVGHIPQGVGEFAVYMMAFFFIPIILVVVATAIPSFVLLVRGGRHRLRVLVWYGVLVIFLMLFARIADIPTNRRASLAVVVQTLGLVASCATVALMPVVWLARNRKA
jgi:hypothetical protein